MNFVHFYDTFLLKMFDFKQKFEIFSKNMAYVCRVFIQYKTI